MVKTNTLLKWKASLDNKSQILLSSWGGNSPCNWLGIACDHSKFISNIHLAHIGLKGALHTLNFSLLPNILTLDMSPNSLNGSIPPQIGMLSKLTHLDLSDNYLFEPIPSQITRAVNLRELTIQFANLTGTIPNYVGNLSFLSYLSLWNCTISSTIGNLSCLLFLFLFDNYLSGSIPNEVGKLHSLHTIQLLGNNLSGSIPSSIGNLVYFESILLFGNKLSGSIPFAIGNLTKLNKLSFNFIGQLPHNIFSNGKLTNSTASNNYFTGLVPKILKICSTLGRVGLEQNQLTGNIADGFGVYPNLDYKDLSENNFYGHLSLNWGKCYNLPSLKISNNNLSASIRVELSQATNLHALRLSSNHFTGGIQEDLGKLTYLFDLSLNNNNLSENVPIQITSLKNLETLELGANNFTGLIPNQLGNLVKLLHLNLSQSKFWESIPSEFAFNKATIEALRNINGLCGNVFGLKPCPKSSDKSQNHKTNKVILVVLPIGLGTLILALFAFGVSYYLCQIEAKKEFDNKHLIGVGGQGNVFKAELHTGQIVAMKKLHSIQNGEMPNIKALSREIQSLTKIRHRNIVKLFGFCSHSRFLFLVYEFLEKRSMGSMQLIKGVASALCYMHHDCSPPIVHRDILSKNILEELSFLILIQPIGPHSQSLLDKMLQVHSFSLLHQEYNDFIEHAYTMEVNEKCDVYSFGVLAIQTPFGEYHEDFITSLLTSSSNFIDSTLDIPSLMGKLDQRLPYPPNPIAKEIVLTVRIANACLIENPILALPWSKLPKNLQC
ncbi:MDIS1-interacting receptor like kinase 2 [Glycine soja]|uniref:non-specific serine/threonine protein kinase n=1 Tax=Glycine soja TaxID=3848 RepID=A0A445J042_GLYSO|nr:MDIS1-interacting receptor like kinase 2 [Glycine soja]